MAEPGVMVIDVDGGSKSKARDVPRISQKRKRASLSCSSMVLTGEQKEAQTEALKKEIQQLCGYYGEMMDMKHGFGTDCDVSGNGSGLNGMVGLLMEGSNLSLSNLVEAIYGKMSHINAPVTLAAVKNAVLFVGQRVMYGVPNVDADVLEDQRPDCLWCWETRDLKLIPSHLRGEIKIHRFCRKMIHERITAVSAMVDALQKSERGQSYKSDLMKASEKLNKVVNETDIRDLVDGMLQKNRVEVTDKESKQEDKMLIKKLERNKRNFEKEKRKVDIELQMERRRAEKEHKRLQEEEAKAAKRREKEETEMRRQVRKQQEETEKELRRKEKEKAELKKKMSIMKQASIMDRFLKRSKANSSSPNDETSTEAITSDFADNQNVKTPEAVTLAMDCTLSSTTDIEIESIRKFHLSSWHHLGHTFRSNGEQHWSIRRKPKTELFKELKLIGNKDLVHDDDFSMEKLVRGWEEQSFIGRPCVTDLENSDAKKFQRRKQLLQFDKSHRPAFYGIWTKKSYVVGPRHPFKKEPDLDYDVDSDEEWEEEDPGESLSDCDMDDEELSLEEGCSKDDEDESEDGFFVPDGYLSENEGAHDRMEANLSVEETRGRPDCMQDLGSEEFRTSFEQQKYLNDLTDIALQRNQPLTILNLMHEKDPFLVAEDLSATSKSEKMCLEALSMCAFPGVLLVEIVMVNMQAEDEDACLSGVNASSHISTVTTIQESAIPIVVSAIQSCSQSINKVVESLQQTFPTVSKTQLRNKVREMSDFVDNRWQVKKEILDKVGVSISPEKGAGRTQNISKFFSKRCLPPASKTINLNDGCSEPTGKPSSVGKGQ